MSDLELGCAAGLELDLELELVFWVNLSFGAQDTSWGSGGYPRLLGVWGLAPCVLSFSCSVFCNAGLCDFLGARSTSLPIHRCMHAAWRVDHVLCTGSRPLSPKMRSCQPVQRNTRAAGRSGFESAKAPVRGLLLLRLLARPTSFRSYLPSTRLSLREYRSAKVLQL